MNRILNVLTETKDRYYTLFGKEDKRINEMRFRDASIKVMVSLESKESDQVEDDDESEDEHEEQVEDDDESEDEHEEQVEDDDRTEDEHEEEHVEDDDRSETETEIQDEDEDEDEDEDTRLTRIEERYEGFDDYHNGANVHNKWRNKLFSMHELYGHDAPQKKIFVNSIIDELYKQVAIGSDEGIDGDLDEYINNNDDPMEFDDEDDENNEDDDDSIPPIVRTPIPKPTTTTTTPTTTNPIIIHTVNVRKKNV
jgi:hypothetical protein